MRKVPRSRQYMYVQDLEHLKVCPSDFKDILITSGALEWAFINHDKDRKPDGSLVRPHYHVVIKFDYPQTLEKVAKMFKDKPEYIEIWKGRINNAYEYLVHETDSARTNPLKYHYSPNEVVASFDFKKKLEDISCSIRRTPKYINGQISQYAEKKISREQLIKSLGVYETAKHQVLIDKIDAQLSELEHEEWLANYRGKKMTVLWLYGRAGVGKTWLAERFFNAKNYAILGSSRDYFQDYEGQHFIILNDLRPDDFQYSDLLRILDPYQHQKSAPSRYQDKKLSAEKIIITTPYDPARFYRAISKSIKDPAVDTIDQLLRRITPIEVTPDLIRQIKQKIRKRNEQNEQEN